MTNRIPDDAFEYYVSLGPDRSYQSVADHYEVTKRGVVKAAARDGWTSRLEAIEQETRERLDKRIGDSLEEMRARHIKLLRAVASRAAKAIQEFPLTSGMEGVKAAETVIKLERIIAGEPSERTGLTVEQVTRQEIDMLLARDDEPEDVEDGW